MQTDALTELFVRRTLRVNERFLPLAMPFPYLGAAVQSHNRAKRRCHILTRRSESTSDRVAGSNRVC